MHLALLPRDKHTYEALSYTWDLNYFEEASESVSIRCNSVKVTINENLYTALCRLRQLNISRILWADALCINQDNIRERSSQVQRMGIIFENAFQVIIWLGKIHPQGKKPKNAGRWWEQPTTVPETLAQESFSGVCEIVNEWRTKAGLLDKIPSATYTTTSLSAKTIPTRKFLSAGSPVLREIFCLYDGRWFRRLWVIQEVALANSAVVIWDDCEILWEWIGLAAAIIRTNFQRIISNIRQYSRTRPSANQPIRRVPTGIINAYFIYRLSNSQRYSQPLQFSSLQLLKLTRQFGCKDDRDRVFGLIGLHTTDGVLESIVSDYSRSTSRVYLEVTRKILDSSPSLSLFSSIQRCYSSEYNRMIDISISRKSRKSRTRDLIPSWVPQWQYFRTQSIVPQEPHPSFSASKGCHLLRRGCNDSSKIILRGIEVDIVKELSHLGSFQRHEQHATTTPHPVYRFDIGTYQDLDQLLKKPEKGRYTVDDLVSISMTLTGGKNWYGLPVENSAAHLADYARCLLKDGLRWSLNGDFINRSPIFSPRSSASDTDQEQPSAHIDLDLLLKLAESGKADRFLDAVATACSGRKSFRTSTGLVGIGPSIIKEGDVICILYGADVPFVIRREGTAGYSVVGECYVEPLMRGEVLEKVSAPRSGLEESWMELV
jgi:hypothetical protein